MSAGAFRSFANVRDGYRNMWEEAVTQEAWERAATFAADAIRRNQERYEGVVGDTGVPWFFVGVLHWMESAGDFSTHLHNGDPLRARTVRVPAGRPRRGKPPFSWEESAKDALALKSLFSDEIRWTVPRVLYEAERYNGFGYAWRGVNSPYVWSGTQHYVRGKYVRDGVFSHTAVSEQVGVAAILKALEEEIGEFEKLEDARMEKADEQEFRLEAPLDGIFPKLAETLKSNAPEKSMALFALMKAMGVNAQANLRQAFDSLEVSAVLRCLRTAEDMLATLNVAKVKEPKATTDPLPEPLLDQLFGLKGYKTIISLGLWALVNTVGRVMFPQYLTPPVLEMLNAVLLGFAGMGAVTKIDRVRRS